MDRQTVRKKITVLLWISFATGIFFFTFYTDDKSLSNLLISFVVAFMYSVVFMMGNALVNDYLNSRYSWIDHTRERIIWGVFATLLVNVGLVLLCNYINFILLQQQDPAAFFSGTMGFVNLVIVNIALLVSAILHAKSFMEEWKKTSKKEVVEQKLIANSANTQFETLKNQLDPHFLFNSLNVLSALIDENPEQAQKFTASMSMIYRYILEQKDKKLVTVEEEINFAKTYTKLLKTRFEDSVHFHFEISESDRKLYVVPLSLQLLLENCIKHNFATDAKPLSVKIYASNGMLNVENNFQGREISIESSGIGLANIVQRYHLLTKKNVFIEKDPTFFRVKIPMLHEISNFEMKSEVIETDLAYQYAVAKVGQLKKFYSNLASFCIVIPVLFLINYLTTPANIWAIWPLLGWGTGLGFMALKTFGVAQGWENRQIRSILNKDNLKDSI